MTVKFDELRRVREKALAAGVGSGDWIRCAQALMDIFPAIYEAAVAMRERERLAELGRIYAEADGCETDRGWLVEWKAHGHGPQWWGFDHAPGKKATWCGDANNAIRFARRVDAERMRLHIIAVAGLTGMHDYERSITATEHEWSEDSQKGY